MPGPRVGGAIPPLVVIAAAFVGAARSDCPANITEGLGLGGDIAVHTTAHAWPDCCALCTADAACTSWTWDGADPEQQNFTCSLRYTEASTHRNLNNPKSKVSGIMPRRQPPPAPAPLPPPPPARPGTQKNVLFITTDDQDLMLGSMRALPSVQRLIAEDGANLTQFRVNTPICCPSRSTMLTGRFEHNNRVSSLAGGGCMHMNSSRFENPEFWSTSSIVRLHKLNYTTGFFGKVLNVMDSYGCDGTSGTPPGLDVQFTMCTHTFFDCDWVNSSLPIGQQLVHTGNTSTPGCENGECYTTSVMGNASVDWIRSVIANPSHPPFYAWIGPHAPHLPSTPAPWYESHPIGLLKAPREAWNPSYNFSAKDHHPLVAGQPILNEKDAASIDEEYSNRMRSLLSVDDMVVELHKLLASTKSSSSDGDTEWARTYVIFSSDHGYSLGQYRLPTHKMQVYENTLRVPFFIRGPNIRPGLQLSHIAGFVDLCPTIVQLASGVAPTDTDGRSFAHFLVPGLPSPAKAWKTTHLTTYQSISKDECLWPTDGGPNPCGRHPVDATANTHTSIRIVNGTHNLLYAEFVDVLDPKAWSFDANIAFHALFDMNLDPWQLHNVYDGASTGTKAQLAKELRNANHCRGQGGHELAAGIECP